MAEIRVLHVIGAMDRGGAETLLMNLHRSIDREKIQFDYLVHEERKCDYDDEIESLGGQIYRVPRFTGVNYLTYKNLCRKHFEQHPEHRIVHGHIGSSAAIYLHEAKKCGRYAIAHSHAQNFNPSLTQFVFNVLSYPTRFVADYFLACSYEAGLDRFGAKVMSGNRSKVLRNGIRVSDYSCTQAQKEEMKSRYSLNQVPVFGHVGRLSQEKNHRFLLDVFKEVKESLTDAKLIFVGRGPLEEELIDYVKNLGLENSVDFLGVRADIPDLLKAMDVFVFPSKKEGLPIALIEAQTTGLPCITSFGISDISIITDKCVQLDFEEGAPKWARVCIEAFEQSKDFDKDGSAEVRAAGFDIEEIAKVLTEIYEQVK